ncbi:MAG TPA: nitroreductase family protein [candidate division Zixibacteria bacterium]|nr:nitroreductase family protein [candidate division Zixibacteria bacterium]
MKFNQSIEKIIRRRYSCRTYKNEPLDNKTIQKINSLLGIEHGIFKSEAKFILIDTGMKNFEEKQKLGTYGMIKGARYFIVGTMNKESINLVDFGYLFEKIILKMTELNLGTVWLGRAFNFDTFSKYANLKESETIPAISPVGYVAEKKSITEKFISWGIRARNRKSWDKIFFEGNFTTPLTEENANYFALPLEMIRLAPSARNLQPWRILKENNMIHFFLKTKSSYLIDAFSYMGLIDVGIALCHFDLMVNELGLEGDWELKEPEIISKPANYNYIASWIQK